MKRIKCYGRHKTQLIETSATKRFFGDISKNSSNSFIDVDAQGKRVKTEVDEESSSKGNQLEDRNLSRSVQSQDLHQSSSDASGPHSSTCRNWVCLSKNWKSSYYLFKYNKIKENRKKKCSISRRRRCKKNCIISKHLPINNVTSSIITSTPVASAVERMRHVKYSYFIAVTPIYSSETAYEASMGSINSSTSRNIRKPYLRKKKTSRLPLKKNVYESDNIRGFHGDELTMYGSKPDETGFNSPVPACKVRRNIMKNLKTKKSLFNAKKHLNKYKANCSSVNNVKKKLKHARSIINYSSDAVPDKEAKIFLIDYDKDVPYKSIYEDIVNKAKKFRLCITPLSKDELNKHRTVINTTQNYDQIPSNSSPMNANVSNAESLEISGNSYSEDNGQNNTETMEKGLQFQNDIEDNYALSSVNVQDNITNISTGLIEETSNRNLRENDKENEEEQCGLQSIGVQYNVANTSEVTHQTPLNENESTCSVISSSHMITDADEDKRSRNMQIVKYTDASTSSRKTNVFLHIEKSNAAEKKSEDVQTVKAQKEVCPATVCYAVDDDDLAMKELLELCKQDAIKDFESEYNWRSYTARRLGESSYAEVFRLSRGRYSTVLKIIPIMKSGKKFKNLLAEVKISLCLNELRCGKQYYCTNFCEFRKIAVVQGLFPDLLIEAWVSDPSGSFAFEPETFGVEQKYVIFEMAYGGTNLNHYQLNALSEVTSILLQLGLALTVGEQALLFEHRDLHLGNILIRKTCDRFIHYKIHGKSCVIETYGVLVSIIDFTFSKIVHKGHIYHSDLSPCVSLFNQIGDEQFDLYRMMKKDLKNNWSRTFLHVNIIWLQFVAAQIEERVKNLHPKNYRNASEYLVLSKYIETLKHSSSASSFLAEFWHNSSLARIVNMRVPVIPDENIECIEID